MLSDAYDERNVGITYGGNLSSKPILEGNLKANINLTEPAAADLAAHADATWGDRNIYALLLTFAGGAVLHQTKKLALTLDSSMETEAVGSSKAAEAVAHAREILRGLGIPVEGPTLISTDNLANQRVGSGIGCPTRSRHFLRRYWALKQRIADGECTLRYVPDENMPADFLTKWISRAKLELSLRYACNSRQHANPEPANDASTTSAHGASTPTRLIPPTEQSSALSSPTRIGGSVGVPHPRTELGPRV